MGDTLHFLPWLRRGLGLTLGELDTGQPELPRAAPVPVRINIDTDEAKTSLALRPADHVAGIDTSQITRQYPAPGSVDAEYGYFPLVEFSAPDLPWVLTPATADEGSGKNAKGRLRPWLVLVCVETAEAEFVPAEGGRPARLIVGSDQLPELAESYAWAHVQSAVPPEDVEASLTDLPGAVICRLVCPRRLEPDTAYRVAVVPAFVPSEDRVDLVPGWGPDSPSTDPIDLAVYVTWTFVTGQAGSFEELCNRLGPVEEAELSLPKIRAARRYRFTAPSPILGRSDDVPVYGNPAE